MHEEFWWKHPGVIIEPSLIPKTFGVKPMVNFATKMLLLVLLFGTAFYFAGGPVAASASVATLIYIISIQLVLNPPKKPKDDDCQVELVDQREDTRRVVPMEGFEDLYSGSATAAKAQYASYLKTAPGYAYEATPGAPKIPRHLSPKNPFKNVMPPDILDTPGVFAVSAYDDNMKLDDFFRTSWFSDPNDVFGKTQSQRQFYTMPSTSVPNDRESYTSWLYGNPSKTCKEGDKKSCVATTGGDKLTWLNMF